MAENGLHDVHRHLPDRLGAERVPQRVRGRAGQLREIFRRAGGRERALRRQPARQPPDRGPDQGSQCVGRIGHPVAGVAVCVPAPGVLRGRHDQRAMRAGRVEVAAAIAPVGPQRRHRGGTDRHRALPAPLADEGQRPDPRGVAIGVITCTDAGIGQLQLLADGLGRLAAPQTRVPHQQDRRPGGPPLARLFFRAFIRAARIERVPQLRPERGR